MKAIDTSIFDLFKIGPGPSSSHTIGPMKIGKCFLDSVRTLPDSEKEAADNIKIHLYGSLSSTGKGHGTDRSVIAGLLGWEPESCDTAAFSGLLHDPKMNYEVKLKNKIIPVNAGDIIFDAEIHSFPFQNTIRMLLRAGERVIFEKQYYSIGGGFIKTEGESEPPRPQPPYLYHSMKSLRRVLDQNNLSLSELMLANEKAVSGLDRDQVFDRLHHIVKVMEDAVERGLKTEGVLPGQIGLRRKAPVLYRKLRNLGPEASRFIVSLNAYTMAVSEENAAGNKVVTAPTSGSAGVIPGVISQLCRHCNTSREEICEGLLAAAAVGFIARHNASISGAEVGCQGEIGVSSAMAAAMVTYLDTLSIELTENAAEIALEHHLGMTCDPVDGYVQIPCIERNAVGAVDAYNAYLLASVGDPARQKITLDEVIEAMLETGRDMCTKYKETSKGGLAVCAVNC